MTVMTRIKFTATSFQVLSSFQVFLSPQNLDLNKGN